MSDNVHASKHRVALLASMAISLVIVAYLFQELDWKEVWVQLNKVNLFYLAALGLSLIFLIWLRAMRWRLILPDGKNLSVPRLMDATIVGFFASFVLPLRAGEIIRPWVLSRWQPVSFSSALASILLERLADSICLLTLLLICLTQMSEVPMFVMAAARILGVLSGALIIMVIVSYLIPRQMERFFHGFSNLLLLARAPKLANKINVMITEYFIGLRVMTSWWQLMQLIVWSFVMWIAVAAWYQALLWTFGSFPSFWVGMMLNVMIALAVAAPSAPGFIGTFQLGCMVALSTVYGKTYGFTKEFAVAFSVIAILLQWLFNVAAGLWVLHRRGLSFRQMHQIETSPP